MKPETNFYIFDLQDNSKEEIYQESLSLFINNENITIFILDNKKFVMKLNYLNFLKITNNIFASNMFINQEYSYDCILNNVGEFSSAIKNDKYNIKYDYNMTRKRWNILYNSNDYLIHFLSECSNGKIIVTGEYALDIYYYIKKYGTDIDILIIDNNNFLQISENYEDYYVIDTNNMSIDLRRKMIGNNYYNRLLDICNLVEINKFRNNYLQKYSQNFVFIEVPIINKTNKSCIKNEMNFLCNNNYKTILKSHIPEIVEFNKKFLGELYSYEMINDICFPAKILIVNGLLSQQNFENNYFHVISGKRATLHNNENAAGCINFYGNCIVFGQMVDDAHTISTLIQDKINEDKYNINAINYGIKSNNLSEIIRNINYNGIFSSDLNVIFYNDTEDDLNIVKRLGINRQYKLSDLFNQKNLDNCFLDTPLHCNYIANEYIAQHLYNKILKRWLKEHSEVSSKLIIPKYERNLYENNKYILQYMEVLKKNYKAGNNGGIVMNCNPFTNGHLELIKYASNMVDTLYVFIIQEDRSIFKFEDRLKMARESCSLFKNVVVLPSGEFLGSAMLFPEYGSEKTNVKIDCFDDTNFFCKIIAPSLDIKYRFVGEENNDFITRHLNDELKIELPKYGLKLIELKRFSNSQGIIFSASYVRKMISENKLDSIIDLVPRSTLRIILENNYIQKIQQKFNNEIKNTFIKEKK